MQVVALSLVIMLTMSERSGHDRIDEPVRMGIPLPKGAARMVDAMTLMDEAGNPIPCQFTVAGRWPGDESIKWVHLDFLTSIKANQVRKLKLSLDAGKNPPAEAKLVVKETDNAVTISTGPLTVRLRGERFSLFDSVLLDGKELIKDAGGGIVLETDTGVYKSALDPDGKVVVESQGPIRTVVRCTGALKDASGRKAFDYDTRFYFYAGQPRVNVAFTYINRTGNRPADKHVMRDLSIMVPVNVPENVTGILGTDKEPKSVAVPVGEALGIFQHVSDRFGMIKADADTLWIWRRPLLEGNGKSTKPLTTGWGALSWPGGGMAAGWRWFWQTFPSIIELHGDGTIRLGLYPREGETALPVYMGQAKTHYLTFVFGEEKPERLNDIYAGVQKPLRAFPDSKYLCQDSSAFGKLGGSDPAFYGDVWPRLANYDKVVRGYMEGHINRIDGALYHDKYWIEGYGYRPWGDAVLWVYREEPYPWNVSWSGNYYDFSFTCLLNFMRLGDFDFLDQFELHTMREADVFTVNYHPLDYLIGACRYCPPRNHIGIDGGGRATGFFGGPYVSLEFNHHKAMSTFALWYLLGDERMRDVALLKLSNAYSNHEADNGWKQIRGPGAQLATLYMGYEYTHDPRYVERMKEMLVEAHRHMDRQGYDRSGGGFMYGIGMEGIIYEYWLTGDERSLKLVQDIVDHMIKKQVNRRDGPGTESRILRMTGNITFALAYLYHETGNPEYKEWCLKVIERQKTASSGEVKSFGQAHRNLPRALYYLAVPPKK